MAEHETCIGATDEWHRLTAMLDYQPLSGLFYWRVNASNVKAGMVAGSKAKKGYILIRVHKKQYWAHRLAWFFMTGEWPEHQIDHRNLKKDDNRWDNLRLATNARNHLNRSKNSNNTSGYKGVSLDRKAGRYGAYLSVKGYPRFLGYFDTPEEAHVAYSKAMLAIDPEYGRVN